MIYRRLLLAGGILLPLVALGWLMRVAASWRPVAMGKAPQGVSELSELHALSDRVCVSYTAKNSRGYGWFDVSHGQMHKSPPIPRRIGTDGVFSWVLWLGEKLEVTDGQGMSHSFTEAPIDYAEYEKRGEISVRVLPQQNRVLLLARERIYDLNFATGHLNRVTKIEAHLPQALSRDGQTFTALASAPRGLGFIIGDTRSGKILRRIPLRTTPSLEYDYMSCYGHYALFDQPNSTMKVVDTATGKALWSFPLASLWSGNWILDSQEKNIFILRGKEWQMCDLKTGKLLRRLPVVPGTTDAAISPDGATLYSVAKDVLYRQRAR
ncbi:hypothetical protein IAD21_02958 [Abditibacteriota bacterium]|nr:hypothetical protein IAD21_02958 [Abditibacteriota bacterium]